MRPFDPSLLRTLPRARRSVARLAGVGVLSGIVALVQTICVAWSVTALVRGEPLRDPLVALASVMVARGLIASAGEVVTRRAGHQVSGEVRRRVLQRWLVTPPDARPEHDAAVNLAGNGVTSLEPYVAKYLPALITAVVVPPLATAVLLWVDPWSALILVLTLPLLPLFAALIGMHTADDTERRWNAMHALSGHFLDVVRGLPTLVAYGRAEQQIGTVDEVGDRHRRASVRTLRTAFLSSAALELLATISVAMVAVAVGLRLAGGSMDLRVGLTAILIAPEAYWPIRRVGQEFHNAADGAGALATLKPYLAAPGAGRLADRRDDPADHGSQDEIVVDSVSFGYPDRPDVLDGASLTTSSGPGLTILTGPSGCGKSTLLDLIARVRTPAMGTISAAPAHLATQRPLLMAGTVLDALRLGAPQATDDECRAVLGVVGLWSALTERNGLDTVVGDDGVGLSAGQRTRLALARALLARQPLTLLDEPTAHVDNDDLDDIRDIIVRLARDRRVIVATHDDGLVTRADDRWVLDGAAAAHPEPRTAPQITAERPGDTSTDPQSVPVRHDSRWQERPISVRLALASLLGGGSMMSGVALTATSGWLIVEASTQPVVLTLLVAIVGVRAFGIARPILRYAERVVSHDAALETLATRRVDVYRHLIPLTPARLGRQRRGDLLTAVATDLDDAVDEQVRVRVPWQATVLASASAVTALLFVLPLAGLIVTAGTAAVLAITRAGTIAERAAQRDAVEARGAVQRATTDLVDRIDHVRAVIGCRADESSPALDIIDVADRSQGRAESKLIRARAVTLTALWCVVAATVVTTISSASGAFGSATISAPVAALVALVPIALTDAWVGLAEIGGARARSQEAEVRLASVLDQEPAISDEGTRTLRDGVLPVLARDVRAAWTSRQTPLGPFTLPPLTAGARHHITGANGTGKSTVLAVLARHLDPMSGTHLLAGTAANEVALADARSDIAIVDDEPHAFAGTIRANLVLAAPDSTDHDLLAALDAADLMNWVHRQPDLLDTRLAGLSGGERTRLSIARAILSKRRLVLLDEPIAHLDDATAARSLCSLMADPTRAVVTVSHQPLPTFHHDIPNASTDRPAASMVG